MRYSKPAITIKAQLLQLKSRGMSISDHAEARHFLRTVGYYRLAGYWWTMQSNAETHRFRRGSSFKRVIQRYNFDRELRLIALNMIERVEVGLRTQMIYQLSLAHQPHWLEDETLAKTRGNWIKNRNSITEEVRRSKEQFILEHKAKYTEDERLPPSWKSLEVVSLGTLSKVYRNMKDDLPEKATIATGFQLDDYKTLSNWLHAIALLRNVSAHHCRLFQRTMEIWPRLPRRLPGPWMNTRNVDTKSVYAHLCCLQYLLHTISPNNRFPDRLEQLFLDYPQVRHRELGFPANWQQQPVWR
ncbi:hypothetical protein CEQ90_13630 [Lewinellaceae bacterium SD302]|nr:hypothetical protein CEQ90_13630 [Lewinellaceae bacterium SD302]